MLEIVNVSKKFSEIILDNVSLKIPLGKIVGLAGANGSGKSTLISIITNTTTQDSGKVFLNNIEINKKNQNNLLKIGFVPQNNCLFENISVDENIQFWNSAFKKKYKSKFFSGENLKKKSGKLSGGEKKLLSIELALIGEPNFLIMDEPTSALDIMFQKEIMDLIKNFVDENHSVFFTSHYASELILCDDLYVIKNGKIFCADELKSIKNEHNFQKNLISLIKK